MLLTFIKPQNGWAWPVYWVGIAILIPSWRPKSIGGSQPLGQSGQLRSVFLLQKLWQLCDFDSYFGWMLNNENTMMQRAGGWASLFDALCRLILNGVQGCDSLRNKVEQNTVEMMATRLGNLLMVASPETWGLQVSWPLVAGNLEEATQLLLNSFGALSKGCLGAHGKGFGAVSTLGFHSILQFGMALNCCSIHLPIAHVYLVINI